MRLHNNTFWVFVIDLYDYVLIIKDILNQWLLSW
jgi:hypothetical protein